MVKIGLVGIALAVFLAFGCASGPPSDSASLISQESAEDSSTAAVATAPAAAPVQAAASGKEAAEPAPQFLLIRKTVLLGNGVLDSYVTFAYDAESNHLLKEERFLGDGSGDGSTTYTYAGELLMETVAYDPQGLPLRSHRYEYDEAGRLLLDEFYNEDGTKTSATEYAYADDGRRSGVRIVDGSGSLLGYNEYQYESPSITRIDMRSPAGNLDQYMIRTLRGDEDLVTEEVIHEPDGAKISTVRFEYEAGRMVQEKRLRAAEVVRTTDYEYDPSFNLIREITRDGTSKIREVIIYDYQAVEE